MIRALVLFAAFFAAFVSPAAAASERLSYDDFARLPVQHEGRIKPLDSFARGFLAMIAGGERLQGMDANAWLAESLFDPAQALHRPVFRLFRPQILDLPTRENRYYSYAEIAPALLKKANTLISLAEKDQKDLSEDQKELLRINEASFLYVQLLRSFSILLPLNVTPPDILKIAEEKPFTLEEYRRHKKTIEDRLQSIIRKKGADPKHYSEEDVEIADFAFKMQVLEDGGGNNLLFRILPGQGPEWFSPWMIGESGQGSPEAASYLELWKAMAYAYLEQDPAAWSSATKNAAIQGAVFAKDAPLSLEILYNQSHALTFAHLFYFLALLALILGAVKPATLLTLATAGALGMGIAFHAFSIAVRVIILSRPPVGTLYESILFVALVCAIAGLIMWRVRKDVFCLLCGAGVAAFLLFIARGFEQGTDMPVLVAVLNTNFWLATHVLCITTGYAWCLMTSAFAHMWLYRAARGHDTSALQGPMKTLAITALLFTAVGTILGGIWADQSWGRFWGWDPKENGALLIVLWLVWILHGQISGHIGRVYAAVFYAALSVIVALAWFGVNLLNTGLHSYGFITGVAAGLGAFCAVEALVIGAMTYKGLQQKRRASCAT